MAGFMGRQQRISAAQAPIATPISLPSPTNGWNARDELDAMDPLDAVRLDNWFPDAGGLFVRNGSSAYATGMPSAPVETLAEYHAGGVNKMLAACGGGVYDISSGGAVGAALASGFTSNRWQTCAFLSRTVFVNGHDHGKIYDGTTFVDDAFTGVSTATLIGIWQYQNRLFFWQAASTGFYFALLNSISGALSFYDLSPFCPRGGNLVAMTSISYDGGNGVIDYAAFMMSSGDVLVFQGNDPALSSNWSLAGQYRMAAPVNLRAVVDYGGDSFVTTFDDHVTLQQMLTALRAGQMAPRSKVSKAVQQAVNANGDAFGWQALYYPRGRSLIFNIPNVDGTFSQHVCNTALPKQPWCRYEGLNAHCFGLYKDFLYFGGANGIVYLADTGNSDSGAAIAATAQQAWNKLGVATRKRVTAVRPVVQSVGQMSFNFGIGFDYTELTVLAPGSTAPVGSPWDVSAWDTSPWSSEITVDTHWRGGGGTGTSIGFVLVVGAVQQVAWYRTDIRIEGGNAL